jgi:hypothetical protein
MIERTRAGAVVRHSAGAGCVEARLSHSSVSTRTHSQSPLDTLALSFGAARAPAGCAATGPCFLRSSLFQRGLHQYLD